MQVTSQVMRMLGGSIEREVTRNDPEWAAAIALPTVSEKIQIIPSRKRKGLQDGNSANGIIDSTKRLVRTSYKEKIQKIGAQKKIVVTFEEPDNDWMEVESENAEHENFSGESDVEENGHVNEQYQTNQILSGKFRWLSRTYKLEPAVEACSLTDSSGQPLEEFRDRHLLREELEQRIRNVRVRDTHITSRDSGKRLGQGSMSRP